MRIRIALTVAVIILIAIVVITGNSPIRVMVYQTISLSGWQVHIPASASQSPSLVYTKIQSNWTEVPVSLGYAAQIHLGEREFGTIENGDLFLEDVSSWGASPTTMEFPDGTYGHGTVLVIVPEEEIAGGAKPTISFLFTGTRVFVSGGSLQFH
ncbi:MAG: hypothetical protein M1366_02790 [Patescibacteria group bacterium]|nr:hypothetical protein [Patescibacteria group bacterium]